MLRLCLSLLTIAILLSSGQAMADCGLFKRFDDGWWRVEMNGVAGLPASHSSRDGDFLLSGSVEYEWPTETWERATLGLRAYPLFAYHEEAESRDHTIYGGAIGITGRAYRNKEQHDGLFAELAGAALYQSREFERNTSRFNFCAELGVGYKFPESHWHVTAKFVHISNGGLGSRNSGVNGLGLAVGRSF